MEKDTPEIKGWRAFKFLFGKSEESERLIDSFLGDITVNTESIGHGCYHTVVDYDQLDSDT